MFPSFLSGIKNNTRAVKEVFRVKISQTLISYSSGIKKDTRAVKGARGMMIMFPSFLAGIKKDTRAAVRCVYV